MIYELFTTCLQLVGAAPQDNATGINIASYLTANAAARRLRRRTLEHRRDTSLGPRETPGDEGCCSRCSDGEIVLHLLPPIAGVAPASIQPCVVLSRILAVRSDIQAWEPPGDCPHYRSQLFGVFRSTFQRCYARLDTLRQRRSVFAPMPAVLAASSMFCCVSSAAIAFSFLHPNFLFVYLNQDHRVFFRDKGDYLEISRVLDRKEAYR